VFDHTRYHQSISTAAPDPVATSSLRAQHCTSMILVPKPHRGSFTIDHDLTSIYRVYALTCFSLSHCALSALKTTISGYTVRLRYSFLSTWCSWPSCTVPDLRGVTLMFLKSRDLYGKSRARPSTDAYIDHAGILAIRAWRYLVDRCLGMMA